MIRYPYYFLLLMSIFLLACEEEDVQTGEDHFLNYEIPAVEPTQDYQVGATYQRFTWNGNLSEVPAAGFYDAVNGDPAVYEQQIRWATDGGIDFFIFPMRSAVEAEQFSEDSAFVATLQTATNAGDMAFALAYNFSSMELANDNRIEDAELVDQFVEDFRKMNSFFQLPHYATVAGRRIITIESADNLYAHENNTLYETLRAEMAELGVELYIIHKKQEWTPPLRFDFRFVGGADAVSHYDYTSIAENNYDRFILFHQFVDQALVYSRDALVEYGLDYVPEIAPSFTARFNDPSSTLYAFEKDAEWFRTYCNIAKRSASDNGLILIDSFNSWNNDKQLEPSQSYGTQYLDIVREEFKVN